jgi:hypothetical protein
LQDKLRRIAGTRDLSTVNALALVLDTKSADRSFGAVRLCAIQASIIYRLIKPLKVSVLHTMTGLQTPSEPKLTLAEVLKLHNPCHRPSYFFAYLSFALISSSSSFP